jgi:hypothetical protein
MKTIWKFPFDTVDRFAIDMPKEAQIMSVQEQVGQPCIWALVDPVATKERRNFAVFGTGNDVPLETTCGFIGTYQLHSGAMVFHLFEI